MSVLGIHATEKEIAAAILNTGFRPGRSLANYLGEGAYFYLVHGDSGYQNAIQSAEKVARRHYLNVEFLVAHICVDHALNLQNPAIRPLFDAFGATFDQRRARLGVHVEANDNASYYRPESHLTIEAFRRAVEAVSGRAFDVLSARFALKRRDIDIEVPHEICVKRSRAILSVERCRPADRKILQSSDPASWPCSDGTKQAAEQAVRLIAAMDDRDLFDLITSIHQGSDGYWKDPHPRFAGVGPIHLLYDSRQPGNGVGIARLVVDAGQSQHRTIQPVDLALTARATTPHAQRLIAGFVEKTAGMVALLTPGAAEVVSLLVTVAERRPEVPILALLTASPSGDPLNEPKAPMVLRSRHNVCCLSLPPAKALGEFVRGFLHDRWSDALIVLDIESKMAARHGSKEARHRDARRIIEAYHARQHNLL